MSTKEALEKMRTKMVEMEQQLVQATIGADGQASQLQGQLEGQTARVATLEAEVAAATTEKLAAERALEDAKRATEAVKGEGSRASVKTAELEKSAAAVQEDLLATRSRERAESQRAADAERKLQAAEHELGIVKQKQGSDQQSLHELMQASESKLAAEREVVAAAAEGRRVAEAKLREMEGQLASTSNQATMASKGAADEVVLLREDASAKAVQENPTPNTHTPAHTHTHARTHTHAHTHTHDMFAILRTHRESWIVRLQAQIAQLTEKVKAAVAESRALEDKMGAAEIDLLSKKDDRLVGMQSKLDQMSGLLRDRESSLTRLEAELNREKDAVEDAKANAAAVRSHRSLPFMLRCLSKARCLLRLLLLLRRLRRQRRPLLHTLLRNSACAPRGPPCRGD